MKKRNFRFFIFSSTIILIFFFVFNFTQNNTASPELVIHKQTSILGKKFGKVVAASCGFTLHGSGDEYSACSTTVDCSGYNYPVSGTSQCGGTCQPGSYTCPACSNGATNYPTCSTCPSGYTMIGGTCIVSSTFCAAGITPTVTYTGYQLINNGVYAYPKTNGKPTPSYSVGSCSQTLPTQIERRCEISRTSSDGSQTSSWTENYATNHTIWSNQPTKVYPYTENTSVRCGYFNTSTGAYISQGSWVTASSIVIHPNYGLACTNTDGCSVITNGTYDIYGVCNAANANYSACTVSNACGQPFPALNCPSGCKVVNGATNLDSSCITNFKVTSDNINPNGSVEFTWETATNTGATCGFVDLTTPTPRLIPGLQNLDTNTNRARISNIQATTRFCLVCQFYNLLTNAALGETAVHQWVRVQRVGEN